MGNTNSTRRPKQEPPPPPPPPPEAEAGAGESAISTPFTCEICIEPTLPSTKKFRNGGLCVHPFCVDCIIKYIQVKVEDDHVADVRCPGLNCDQLLDPLSCRPLMGPQLFDKWCDVLCERAVLGFEDRCYCPNRRCSALVVNECGGDVKRSQCPNCKRLFCFRCSLPWHAGYRCEESGEMRDRNDVAFGVLAERNKWMRCPTCNHCVELRNGCSIVKCRCGSSFCYNCGRKVNMHYCGCRRAVSRVGLFLRLLVTVTITIILLRVLAAIGGVLKLPRWD